jgi:hypothetical protein
VIGRAKVKKNILIALHRIRKLFVKISFINEILEVSHLLYISENTGNKSQNIGPITINGIHIIER